MNTERQLPAHDDEISDEQRERINGEHRKRRTIKIIGDGDINAAPVQYFKSDQKINEMDFLFINPNYFLLNEEQRRKERGDFTKEEWEKIKERGYYKTPLGREFFMCSYGGEAAAPVKRKPYPRHKNRINKARS